MIRMPARAATLAVVAIMSIVLAGVFASAGAAAPAKPGPSSQPVATSPCGAAVPRADGGYWQCTFADDFSGSQLDRTKWAVQRTDNSGYHAGPACFVDSPRNIRVSGGRLSLTARAASPFTCKSPLGDYTAYATSGMVTGWQRFSQAFGRFEIRASFPSTTVAGVQSALWLWPQKEIYGLRPNSGEIDIAEFYSVYPDRAIPYLHYTQDSYDPTVTNNYCMIKDPTAFHTYVAEWTTTTITITYDGVTCLRHTIDPGGDLQAPQPFDQPFFVALTQALGVGTNAYSAATPLPATMQVDYVHVWS